MHTTILKSVEQSLDMLMIKLMIQSVITVLNYMILLLKKFRIDLEWDTLDSSKENLNTLAKNSCNFIKL
jgi:hypothetical protein